MRQKFSSPRIGRHRRGSAVAACALLGTALAVTACSSGSSTPSAGTSKTVTLQFWSAYNTTDAEASTMAHVVIPRFEKLNPGIKVVSVVYPYSDLLQKFLAAAAAGDPPDLMRSDIQWVPQLAGQGVLYPVGKLPIYKAIAQDALPGPLSTTVWQGQNYAFPFDTNTQALFWNKADFKAAGIAGPPTTQTQLIADAKRLTVTSKQQFGLGVDGTDIWNVAPYIWSGGGGFTNSSYTTADGFMNGGGTRSVISTLLGLLKAGDIGSDFRGGAGAVSGETGFPKGQYAMYIDGPWAVPTYTALNPAPDYGIAQVPAGSGGSVSTVGGEDLVISQATKDLAASEKFAQFLESPFAQLAMAKTGQMSALATTGTQEVSATPYFAPFVEQLKTAQARPVSPGYTKLDSDFSNALQEILAGKVSVTDGLNAAAKQADSALANP